MSRLESAWAWYGSQLARLKYIQDLSERYSHEANVRDLLGELLRLKKGERNARLRQEREDLYRMALMRLFAGFEADFREEFLTYMERRGGASRREIEGVLPDSISTWLVVYQVLEPVAFSRSSLGQINRIRDERNRLAHGGFHQDISHTSPDDTFAALGQVLRSLERSGTKLNEIGT